jgi:predicted HicB family RNase H-like nuclease
MANFDLNDDFVKGAEERAKSNKSKPSDNLVMLNARVPKRLRDRVKLAAVTHDRSNASIIEEALEEWLKKAEKRNESRITAFEDDGL